MILYLDTSALVKKYVMEAGSDAVNRVVSEAEIMGISVIGRIEMVAAFGKAVRIGRLEEEVALAALQLFRNEWGTLAQIQVTEMVIARAEIFAWEYRLRGYDAVHLASALIWQEVVEQPVTMALFDKKLWTAVKQVGLIPFPSDLNAFS